MKNSVNQSTKQNNKSVENILLIVLLIVGGFGIFYIFNQPSEDASKKLEDQIVQLSHYMPKAEQQEGTLAASWK
ncbi:MAG: hypothetical protein MRY78_01005 [Saprospiraceae bacterium]|nr:hypothetical protein [Saprospiraceae bacterium]